MSTFPFPRGCVLWYNFATLSGSKVYDQSGNDNHGTIYGALWKRGTLVGALKFDGVDDYVEVPDDPSINPTDAITMELFILPLDAGNDRDRNSHLSFKRKQYGFHWDHTTLGMSWYLYIAGAWAILEVPTNKVFPANKLYHLVCWYDGSEMRIYINKELILSKSQTGSIEIGSAPLGVWAFIGQGYFPGDIMLYRLYNRALTEKEIKAHYTYLTSPIKVEV